MSVLFCYEIRKRRPHLARFRVPEKVGPVGVRLHFTKDEQFTQAEIDHPRRDLRVPR